MRDPLALDLRRVFHRLLRAQTLGVETLGTQYVVGDHQIAAPQQTDVQGKIQRRNEAGTLLGQGWQKLHNIATAKQRTTESTQYIDREFFKDAQYIVAFEQATGRRQ
ncbi:hypothetical protein D3C87_1220530 [compost metagenome]